MNTHKSKLQLDNLRFLSSAQEKLIRKRSHPSPVVGQSYPRRGHFPIQWHHLWRFFIKPWLEHGSYSCQRSSALARRLPPVHLPPVIHSQFKS